MEIQQDLAALTQIPTLVNLQRQLNKAGFKAWLAGGCVRDACLGRKAKDFDFVTDADIETLKRLFPRHVLVGEQFGVLRVHFEGQEFEIAQFRKESDYKDGRRPSLVESATPPEDAARRDLTVNALFYDLEKKTIYDYVDGMKDLKAHLLHAVGDANKRFQEDHLRILRALRFWAQLEFSLDAGLEKAIREEVELLAKVSRERIRDELIKMTQAPGWGKLIDPLVKWRVNEVLFSDLKFSLAAHHKLNSFSEEAVFWEWGLWALRSANEIQKVKDAIHSLRISRAQMKSTDEFLFWFTDEKWQSETLGALLERSFHAGSLEGFEAWNSLNRGGWPRADEFLSRRMKLGISPAPWIKAQDLPTLKGAELGGALKEAYHRQLEGADSSRDEALAVLRKKFA